MASPLDDWPLSTFRIQTIATHSTGQVSCTSLNCGRLSNSQSRKHNFFFLCFRTYYSRSIQNLSRNRSSNLSLPQSNPPTSGTNNIMNFSSIHSLTPNTNTPFKNAIINLILHNMLPKCSSSSPSISSSDRASLQI